MPFSVLKSRGREDTEYNMHDWDGPFTVCSGNGFTKPILIKSSFKATRAVNFWLWDAEAIWLFSEKVAFDINIPNYHVIWMLLTLIFGKIC